MDRSVTLDGRRSGSSAFRSGAGRNARAIETSGQASERAGNVGIDFVANIGELDAGLMAALSVPLIGLGTCPAPRTSMAV